MDFLFGSTLKNPLIEKYVRIFAVPTYSKDEGIFGLYWGSFLFWKLPIRQACNFKWIIVWDGVGHLSGPSL